MRAITLLALLPLVLACRSTDPAPYRPEAPLENLHDLVAAYGDAADVNLTFNTETRALLESIRVRSIPAGEQQVFVLEPAPPTLLERFETIRLEYALADEVAGHLRKLVAHAGGTRIAIIADDRTNSVLLFAPKEQLARMKELVVALDVEV